MKKVKFISLVFENCDSAKLLPHMFYGLRISNITRSTSINCAQYRDGEQYEDLSCRRFSIVINEKGLASSEFNVEPLKDGPKNLKERLERWRDITHIDIVYSYDSKKKLPKEHEYIAVPWFIPEDMVDEQCYRDYDFTNYCQEHVCGGYLRNGEMMIKIEEK